MIATVTALFVLHSTGLVDPCMKNPVDLEGGTAAMMHPYRLPGASLFSLPNAPCSALLRSCVFTRRASG